MMYVRRKKRCMSRSRMYEKNANPSTPAERAMMCRMRIKE